MTNGSNSASGPKLSRRLSALAEWVPQGARFADIGTDHGLLPVYLAATGRIAYAVAGDVHAGPADAARRQVAAAGLTNIISVRLGDGLAVLEPGEVDTVCLAGMGGSLMIRLLNAAGDRLNGVQTLVLSPHVAEDQVRRWFTEHGFVLEQERIILEDGEFYTLLKAERAISLEQAQERNNALYDPALLGAGSMEVPEELLYAMGPLLLRGRDETFHAKWQDELRKRARILDSMRQAVSPESALKAAAWESLSDQIREVLACWQEERQ